MSRFFSIVILFFSGLALASPKSVDVILKDGTGNVVGKAVFTQLSQGVEIKVDAHALKPGEHAIHLHENGVCKGPDFDSAGAHLKREKQGHGFDAAKGPHIGDLPNILVGDNGTVHAEIINSHVTLTAGPTSLLKDGGTSLIIHAGMDDYKTQPAGTAGGRIACGEIKRP